MKLEARNPFCRFKPQLECKERIGAKSFSKEKPLIIDFLAFNINQDLDNTFVIEEGSKIVNFSFEGLKSLSNTKIIVKNGAVIFFAGSTTLNCELIVEGNCQLIGRNCLTLGDSGKIVIGDNASLICKDLEITNLNDKNLFLGYESTLHLQNSTCHFQPGFNFSKGQLVVEYLSALFCPNFTYSSFHPLSIKKNSQLKLNSGSELFYNSNCLDTSENSHLLLDNADFDFSKSNLILDNLKMFILGQVSLVPSSLFLDKLVKEEDISNLDIIYLAKDSKLTFIYES